MRAVTVSEYGGIPVVGEMPAPEPGAGQVLLRMRAAGMNPMDATRVPDGLDPVMAAALPTAGGAGLALVASLESLAGQTVLIVGAGGGVGSFATQFAVNAGARVIANVHAAVAERMRGYGAAENRRPHRGLATGRSATGAPWRHRRPHRSGQRRGRLCRA